MLPDSERTRIPIGSYEFKIIEEPEARKNTGQGGKKFTTILFKFKAMNEAGEIFDHMESILAFEERYDDLLLALGAEKIKGRLSGKTIDPVGMKFKGEIVHEPDKEDPTKTWARIAKIQPIDHETEINSDPKEKDRFHDPEEELPVRSPAEKEAEEEDECPF